MYRSHSVNACPDDHSGLRADGQCHLSTPSRQLHRAPLSTTPLSSVGKKIQAEVGQGKRVT
jgi:hypothetical protein